MVRDASTGWRESRRGYHDVLRNHLHLDDGLISVPSREEVIHVDHWIDRSLSVRMISFEQLAKRCNITLDTDILQGSVGRSEHVEPLLPMQAARIAATLHHAASAVPGAKLPNCLALDIFSLLPHDGPIWAGTDSPSWVGSIRQSLCPDACGRMADFSCSACSLEGVRRKSDDYDVRIDRAKREVVLCYGPSSSIFEVTPYAYPRSRFVLWPRHRSRKCNHGCDTAPVSAARASVSRQTPVLLLPFSALTFNRHRIHYDRDYARDVEGYPGLVVHGPLMATLLVTFTRANFPHRRLPALISRRRTVDRSEAFDLGFRREGGVVQLSIGSAAGHLTMSASLTVSR